MPPHKSEDYKISAVQYYLSKNKNQVQTCEIFQCVKIIYILFHIFIFKILKTQIYYIIKNQI